MCPVVLKTPIDNLLVLYQYISWIIQSSQWLVTLGNKKESRMKHVKTNRCVDCNEFANAVNATYDHAKRGLVHDPGRGCKVDVGVQTPRASAHDQQLGLRAGLQQ